MTSEQMEKERIEQLVSEYEREGYKVQVQPRGSDLPSFLREFRPDLVAMSGTRNVVIEVKSTSNFDADEVQKLAKLLESKPSWKLEVVLVNPPVARDVTM